MSETAAPPVAPLHIDPRAGRDLLFRMMRIRHVEEEIAARYAGQKMRCPVHLCSGQEAVSAAAGMCLRHDDLAVSGHRAHGHYLGKGGSLSAMLAEIYGKRTGCAGGRGGSMHLIDESVGFKGSTAIVGNTIPIGVGLGYSILLQGTDQISCIFFGDGAVETGAFYESANFAALKRLAVLFVCENNFYSVYSPMQVRQPEGRQIHRLAEAIGMRATQADGNDAQGVYTALRQAVGELRAGAGPRFLEFITYRWREHCGPNFDNHIGYRTEDEYLSWRAKEPIARLRRQLLDANAVSDREVEAMQRDIEDETEAAFRFAEESPFPDGQSALSGLYA